jgi:hypothetical protein
MAKGSREPVKPNFSSAQTSPPFVLAGFITLKSEVVPSIQAPGANPGPISSSADKNSADMPRDMRNSNNGNTLTP